MSKPNDPWREDESTQKEAHQRLRRKLVIRLNKARDVRFAFAFAFVCAVALSLAANWQWIDVETVPLQNTISHQLETVLGLGVTGAVAAISHAIMDATASRIRKLDATRL